jgi:hypothetical protein
MDLSPEGILLVALAEHGSHLMLLAGMAMEQQRTRIGQELLIAADTHREIREVLDKLTTALGAYDFAKAEEAGR